MDHNSDWGNIFLPQIRSYNNGSIDEIPASELYFESTEGSRQGPIYAQSESDADADRRSLGILANDPDPTMRARVQNLCSLKTRISSGSSPYICNVRRQRFEEEKCCLLRHLRD